MPYTKERTSETIDGVTVVSETVLELFVEAQTSEDQYQSENASFNHLSGRVLHLKWRE